MAVATPAQKRLTKVQENALEHTEVVTNDPLLPTLAKFISVQRTDAYCNSISTTVGISKSFFKFDKNGLSLRYSPIDCSVQHAVPESTGPVILHLAHPPTLAGLPGEPKMYDTLGREYHWPNTSTNQNNSRTS